MGRHHDHPSLLSRRVGLSLSSIQTPTLQPHVAQPHVASSASPLQPQSSHPDPLYNLIEIHTTVYRDASFLPLCPPHITSTNYLRTVFALLIPSHIFVWSRLHQTYVFVACTQEHILFFKYVLTSALSTHLHLLLANFVAANPLLSSFVYFHQQLHRDVHHHGVSTIQPSAETTTAAAPPTTYFPRSTLLSILPHTTSPNAATTASTSSSTTRSAPSSSSTSAGVATSTSLDSSLQHKLYQRQYTLFYNMICQLNTTQLSFLIQQYFCTPAEQFFPPSLSGKNNMTPALQRAMQTNQYVNLSGTNALHANIHPLQACLSQVGVMLGKCQDSAAAEDGEGGSSLSIESILERSQQHVLSHFNEYCTAFAALDKSIQDAVMQQGELAAEEDGVTTRNMHDATGLSSSSSSKQSSHVILKVEPEQVEAEFDDSSDLFESDDDNDDENNAVDVGLNIVDQFSDVNSNPTQTTATRRSRPNAWLSQSQHPNQPQSQQQQQQLPALSQASKQQPQSVAKTKSTQCIDLLDSSTDDGDSDDDNADADADHSHKNDNSINKSSISSTTHPDQFPPVAFRSFPNLVHLPPASLTTGQSSFAQLAFEFWCLPSNLGIAARTAATTAQSSSPWTTSKTHSGADHSFIHMTYWPDISNAVDQSLASSPSTCLPPEMHQVYAPNHAESIPLELHVSAPPAISSYRCTAELLRVCQHALHFTNSQHLLAVKNNTSCSQSMTVETSTPRSQLFGVPNDGRPTPLAPQLHFQNPQTIVNVCFWSQLWHISSPHQSTNPML